MKLTFGGEISSVGISAEVTATGTLQTILDENVADGQTDNEIVVALDVSAVKGFYLVSNQDVLFEPNSGSTPDDPISLLANVPYAWHTNSYDSFFFGTDWTSVFITNASGASARVRCLAELDATP